MGLEVDARCCAVGAGGTVRPMLRRVGPPTVGTFCDPIGAMFIAAQMYRPLPDALHALAGAGPAHCTDHIADPLRAVGFTTLQVGFSPRKD